MRRKIGRVAGKDSCLQNDDDDDDVQWFNVHLKLTRSQLSLARSDKVKTEMGEKNEKQLESVETVW